MEELVEGNLTQELPLDYKDLPEWLRRESSWLFDRNMYIHDIVENLLSESHRLLCLHGEPQNGRSSILYKAIKIVLAHNKAIFKDMLYEVNLENISKNTYVQKISDSLELSNPHAKIEHLYKDLQNKRCLIVFKDCQTLRNKANQEELMLILSKLIGQTTNEVKFVVLLTKKSYYRNYDYEQVIRVDPMTRQGKILLFIDNFKRIRKNEEKLLKKFDAQIRDHDLFDYIDPCTMNQLVRDF